MSGEEKKRILDMLAEGRITAEEAMQLLEQFGAGAPVAPGGGDGERMLRIRVMLLEAGKSTPINVNVNLPLRVARIAGQLIRLIPPQAADAVRAQGVNLQDIDWEGIIDALADTGGDIINVTTGNDGGGADACRRGGDEDQIHVRIYIE